MSEKKVNFRIEPYIREALFQMVLDILVIFLYWVFLAWADFPSIAFIVFPFVYFTIATIFCYKVVIHAWIDKRKKDFVTETVSISQIAEEYSFSGDRTGHSRINLFYPKDLHVGREKIKVINENGEKKRIRTVASQRRIARFYTFKENNIELLKVTYLKRSKILLEIDLAEDLDKKLSQKKKEDIIKAVNYINMAI